MAAIRKSGAPLAELLRLTLTRVVPAGLLLGAAVEGIMYATGFWKIATRKAAERQWEARREASALASAPRGARTT